MNYQNLFKIAIRAIAANKMRSFLTALGIIIGIAAVITMLAIGHFICLLHTIFIYFIMF